MFSGSWWLALISQHSNFQSLIDDGNSHLLDSCHVHWGSTAPAGAHRDPPEETSQVLTPLAEEAAEGPRSSPPKAAQLANGSTPLPPPPTTVLCVPSAFADLTGRGGVFPGPPCFAPGDSGRLLFPRRSRGRPIRRLCAPTAPLSELKERLGWAPAPRGAQRQAGMADHLSTSHVLPLDCGLPESGFQAWAQQVPTCVFLCMAQCHPYISDPPAHPAALTSSGAQEKSKQEQPPNRCTPGLSKGHVTMLLLPGHQTCPCCPHRCAHAHPAPELPT